MAESRWSVPDTIRVARDVVAVAQRHLGRLGERGISSTFLSEALQATDAAEAAAAGQPVRLGTQKGTTVALEDVLARVARTASGVRKAVFRVFADRKELHRAFGVGQRDGASSLRDGLAAIEAIQGAVSAYPTEAAAAAVLQRDLDALSGLRAELLAADSGQEAAKGQKKGGTAARDDLLRDVTRRIDKIVSAADLEFANDPLVLRQFRDPLPSKNKKKGGATPAPAA